MTCLAANINLHDLIANELFEKKSLASLIFLIDSGRELEFTYNGVKYFISRSGSSGYVSLWQIQTEQYFGSIYDLIETANVDHHLFIEVWNFFELDYLS